MKALQYPMEVTLCLNGTLNSGFRQLRKATIDLVSELHYLSPNLRLVQIEEEQLPTLYQKVEQAGYAPIVVHEHSSDGRTAQTMVYPYVMVQYKGKEIILNLLQQDRGKSGEENLNHSIETLEYTLLEAIHTLQKEKVDRIAFLEGHGELSEKDVYDWSLALSRYFQIDRGSLSTQADVLNDYQVVVVADPQLAFSDTDKYILDQYLMQGGKMMWLVNGVKFSQNMLTDDGVTPIISQDLRLTDLFFRYGVRINPVLIQDLQCLNIPVDVSRDPENPQYQPMPWTYAPLLLTSNYSPITRGVMQVSATFSSCLEAVGGEDGIQKEVLLATSSASSLTGTPAEVNLSDLSIHQEQFQYANLPVAVSLEGCFPSLFAHRMKPMGVQSKQNIPTPSSIRTKQIVVATGSICRNDWQQGQALPVGYDRYSHIQFGNRDFLVNAILWLTDDGDLISLRQKSMDLRLLNKQKAYQYLSTIRIISTLLPVLLLMAIGVIVVFYRKNLYKR